MTCGGLVSILDAGRARPTRNHKITQGGCDEQKIDFLKKVDSSLIDDLGRVGEQPDAAQHGPG